MCRPFGEQELPQNVTGSVCPGERACRRLSRHGIPHTNCGDRLNSAETMCRPSGENATDTTESVCPVKGPAAVSPVMAFHTRIV